jgi:hypothetical protein
MYDITTVTAFICLRIRTSGGALVNMLLNLKETPWLESASDLYRPNDRRLTAKLVPTFADRGCHVVSVTDPYGRILGFLNREALRFLSSSSSVVLTRLSGPRSRPTTSQKNLLAPGIQLDLYSGTLTTRSQRLSTLNLPSSLKYWETLEYLRHL